MRHRLPPTPPVSLCVGWLCTSSTSPRTTGKLRRISGAKLDPDPEDEETLVTSLPTPVEAKNNFILQENLQPLSKSGPDGRSHIVRKRGRGEAKLEQNLHCATSSHPSGSFCSTECSRVVQETVVQLHFLIVGGLYNSF